MNLSKTPITMRTPLEAVVSFNQQQRIVQFDPNAEIMFGCTVAEALQKSLHELFPSYYGEKYENQLKLFARDSHGVKREGWLEMRAVRNNGEEFPVEVDITKFKVKGKSIFTAIFREVNGDF